MLTHSFSLPSHSIPFAPSELSVPLSLGFATMCAFDLAMILSRRLWFDHFAHLAGAAAGALWYFVGATLYERMRLRACASLAQDGERGSAQSSRQSWASS